jgi:hypothetical protein
LTLARRLLMAGGGSGAFTPPSGPSVFSLVAAPDGFWQNISNYRAFCYNGKTYFGWVNGVSGDVKIAAYDHVTKTVSTPFTLHTALSGWSGSPDIHNSPALLVRTSDHRIVVGYVAHDQGPLYIRISTNPEDVTAFGTEISVGSGGGWPAGDLTYVSLVQLSGESGAIYMFHRQGGGSQPTPGQLAYFRSTDGGATWGAQQLVMTGAYGMGNVPYWNITTDWNATIHVATTDTIRTIGYPSSLYHFYLNGGSAYKSDGTLIAASASWPVLVSDATLVRGTSEGPASALGVCIGPDGKPAMLLKAFDSGGSTNLIRAARWTGSAWAVTNVADTNGIIGGNDFVGSGDIDPTDPNTVYFPRKVGSYFEMFRYVWDGATWTGTQLTTGSAADNATPGTVAQWGAGLRVIWGLGTFTNANSFSFGVQGYG